MYHGADYDLAGFAVGAAERGHLLPRGPIAAGDVVLGLASSGPHSNGYSLIRRIIERCAIDLNAAQHRQLALDLLMPTRIYVKPLLALLARSPGIVKGMAHITGGGLTENIPRVLPDDLTAQIDKSSWTRPAVFGWLQEQGNLDESEMARTFNCGIGMALVVAKGDASVAANVLRTAGETVYEIGRVRERAAGEPQTIVV
jgi:phosphoribosylformylglycinamidine cyclo-ligase